ncbi:hypothetical protein Agub_g11652, partial [Astrephomene gubernaculifera]
VGLGVRVRCGARVTAIRTSAPPGSSAASSPSSAEAAVAGVTLASGEEVDAEVVLSNRDVPLSYGLLRGAAETHGSARSQRLLAGGEYSAGVIAYLWSVEGRRLEKLAHHNVFLSADYRGSWQRATCPDSLPRCPNFYLHCPARTDPTAAPPGCDSLMVLLPVANMQEILRAQEAERRRTASPLLAALTAGSAAASAAAAGGGEVDYSGLVAAGREAVFRALEEAGVAGPGGAAGLRGCIAEEVVIEPSQWAERYSLAHGAAFGLSHGLSQLSILRPDVGDDKVRGLYHVGASCRPGNGVPLVML